MGEKQPKTGFRLDWAAVSALASAAAVVVALLAYLAPSPPPPPSQPDAPPTTSAPPPSPEDRDTTPPQPSRSPEPRVSERPDPRSTEAAPVSATPLPAVRPGGCDEAATAVAAYRRDAGTTRSGQAAAARQAYAGLMGAALDAQGAAGSTIRRLAAEFQELSFRLTGMTGGDPNQVVADINTDLAELNRLCGAQLPRP